MVKKTMHAKKGSTSILIVIMMVVLMILGLAILTMALSNKRLSDKKIDWKADYYTLESSANRVISQIMLEVDAINQKQVSKEGGFLNIDSLLSDAASHHTMPDFTTAEPAQLKMTITAQNSNKNLNICLLVVEDKQDKVLRLKILEYRQWQ